MVAESHKLPFYGYSVDSITRLKQRSSFLEFLTRDWAQFKFEDTSRFGDVNAVFVDYPKDWKLDIKRLDAIHLVLENLLVKIPLVALLPRETGLKFSFSHKLFSHFSGMLLKKSS